MPGIARWDCVALDCPDADALAAFYGAIVGETPRRLYPDWVEIGPPDRPHLACQQIEDYVAPTWPGGERPQQLHLDFHVDDLERAQAAVISLGATLADVQPLPDEFRVMLDPVGHPFCLVLDTNASH
jgi:catechol 2,3-dioxygenase-like lactoylglutathione lyase family enzyme